MVANGRTILITYFKSITFITNYFYFFSSDSYEFIVSDNNFLRSVLFRNTYYCRAFTLLSKEKTASCFASTFLSTLPKVQVSDGRRRCQDREQERLLSLFF